MIEEYQCGGFGSKSVNVEKLLIREIGLQWEGSVEKSELRVRPEIEETILSSGEQE